MCGVVESLSLFDAGTRSVGDVIYHQWLTVAPLFTLGSRDPIHGLEAEVILHPEPANGPRSLRFEHYLYSSIVSVRRVCIMSCPTHTQFAAETASSIPWIQSTLSRTSRHMELQGHDRNPRPSPRSDLGSLLGASWAVCAAYMIHGSGRLDELCPFRASSLSNLS